MNGIDRITTDLESHLTITVLAVLGAVVVVFGAILAVRSARRRGLTGEQAGTLLAAAIATGVSAQGMWVFFDKSLHLPLSLRIMFFAFLEIMVLTSALRARSAQQVSGSAGIDGVAMWVLTCLSAVLAATDADNIGTVLIRLSAPLVAAWGWERSMALERRRSGALGGINWRITPERLLIRLGIADPTDRTAGEAARQRRLIDVALAADHARTLRETGAGSRRINRARRHLQRVMRRAVEDGGLVDNSRAPRTVLMDNLRVLSGTGALVDLDLPSPWIAEDETGASTGDLFVTPALTTTRAAGAEPVPEQLSGASTVAAAPQDSPESSGAQPITIEPSASIDRTAPQGQTRTQPAAQTPATANSSAAQPVPPIEQATAAQGDRTISAAGQPLPATAQAGNTGQPAAQIPDEARSLPGAGRTNQIDPAASVTVPARDVGRMLPATAQNSPADRTLPGSATPHTDRPQYVTASDASRSHATDTQIPHPDRTPSGTTHPLETSQPLPATAHRLTTQPYPATAQPEAADGTLAAPTQPGDADRTLAATAQTASPDHESSTVTQNLPTTRPLPDAARAWQAAQPVSPDRMSADAARTTSPDEEESPESEFTDHYGPYTATAMPTASPQTAQTESNQNNRQYRRDPAFRERVRELHAINAPTSEIAAQLGTSSRTIRRILADLDAESDGSRRQNRNPAQAAVSNWHNGFRVLPGGNGTAAPASGDAEDLDDQRTTRRADRSMEK